MTEVEDFEEAVRILGLPAQATLAEVKARHRQLVKSHHPDVAADAEPEAIRRINDAYRVVLSYCNNYSFRFNRDEFLEQNPEERLREQFAQDAFWRGGK